MTATTDSRVVFAHTVEAVFSRVLGGNVPPALRDRVRELGIDLNKPLWAAYPLPVWNQVLEATVAAVFPGEPLAQGACRLGERMIEGYRETLVGQAVLAMAKLIGPKRALKRSRQNWRSGNNYTEVELVELGPTDYRLTFNDTGVQRWVSQGLLKGGMTHSGAKGLTVEIERYTEDQAVYRVTWQG